MRHQSSSFPLHSPEIWCSKHLWILQRHINGKTQILFFFFFFFFFLLKFLNLKNCDKIHITLGEGNGTPLQYSCLENPMDGGACWLQSMGLLRVGHDWATSLWLFTFLHWRRKWQPTPVFLPGESQGWGSLGHCHLWGQTELDTTVVT